MSNQIDELAQEVNQQYQASYMDKEGLGLHSDWKKYEEYWLHGKERKKDKEVIPTNIVKPNVESMVADLVMDPFEIMVKGWNRSDRAHAPRTQLALEWVWEKNKMAKKRDRFERMRCKFGGAVWKVYFDGQSAGVIGMPKIEPVNPANFFPDPKVKDPDKLHMADYIIHAVVRPLKYLKAVYGSKVNKIDAQTPSMDPGIHDSSGALQKVAGDKALVLERWSLEDNDKLRKVVVAQDTVLYDSDDDEDAEEKGYYRINRYPFVYVPCRHREGMLWGSSMVEDLIPTQKIMNELDHQMLTNARLTGNIQKVIGVNSGINPNIWTNEPNLNIPARDVDGFRVVEPPSMPPYINNRRVEARDVEAPNIAAREDIVQGRRPGSLRAASAIMALQQQGMKQAMHLKDLTKEGLNEVFTIITDYITEYWTEEQEVGSELASFRGSDLQEIEILDEDDEPLLDEEGNPITRRAKFDISVNIGGGFVNNKAFLFQATLELAQYGLITVEEARSVLKMILSFPLIDPYDPVGEFIRKQQEEEGEGEEGGPAVQPLDVGPEQQMEADFMEEMMGLLGGGGAEAGGPPMDEGGGFPL